MEGENNSKKNTKNSESTTFTQVPKCFMSDLQCTRQATQMMGVGEKGDLKGLLQF